MFVLYQMYLRYSLKNIETLPIRILIKLITIELSFKYRWY